MVERTGRRDMFCDVLVVGAGPAGSTAARTCAARGLRTVLLEEHAQVGRPVHCAGKLSAHAFARFGLPASLAQNALRGVSLHAPDGTAARVRRASADSYMVDRAALDRLLAEQAAAMGAEVITGARARTVSRVSLRAGGRPLSRGLRVEVDREGARLEITAALVIDAEGASPVLPAQLGLAPLPGFVHALQYDLEGVAIEQEDAPELYFGWDVAPGFFGWLVPTGQDRARLGVAVDPRWASRPAVHYLEALRTAHPAASTRVRNARIVRRFGGRIPVRGRRGPTYTDGMLVAGDAAGHVKATSGGGVYFAMQAGEIAGGAAAAYLGGARGALAGYERSWRAAFGRELLFTRLVRRALNRLTDRHVSALIRALVSDEDLRRAVEEHGDTQYQSRLLRPVMVCGLRSALRGLHLAPPGRPCA